jgi:uncharacterized membrane protein
MTARSARGRACAACARTQPPPPVKLERPNSASRRAVPGVGSPPIFDKRQGGIACDGSHVSSSRLPACLPAAHVARADSSTSTRYQVTILSSAGAQANSINDLRLISGSYTLARRALHASLWAYGQQVDLGTLGVGIGLSSRVQWPVKNVLGLISGISLTDQLDPNKEGWSCGFFLNNPNFNVCLGFVWDPINRKMRPLPTLGGTNGFATGTNDFGETVGWAENTVHDTSCISPQVLQFKPVVWGPGYDDIRALPLPDGDTSGAATALNDRGQIVGIAGSCGFAVGGPTGKHAVLWDNEVPDRRDDSLRWCCVRRHGSRD